ncbi:MAG: hypothetical protein ABIO55_01880 [Ginsengibacter sp.]
MRKLILVFMLLLCVPRINAQIEIAKLIGKRWNDYKLGYGAFLKFSYPVSTASDLSIEASLVFFSVKENDGDGLAVVPFKLGYRYTLNGTGSGIYIEPQLGYNFFGANSFDGEHPYKGAVIALGTGYLFKPGGRVQFDLGLRYETVVIKDGSANYIALRLSHNFSFKKREEDN